MDIVKSSNGGLKTAIGTLLGSFSELGKVSLMLAGVAIAIKGYDSAISIAYNSAKNHLEQSNEQIKKYDEEISSLENLQSKLHEAQDNKAKLAEIQVELNDSIGETPGLLNNETSAYDTANAKIKSRIDILKELREEEKKRALDAQKGVFNSKPQKTSLLGVDMLSADYSADQMRQLAQYWTEENLRSSRLGTDPSYSMFSSKYGSGLMGLRISESDWNAYWNEQVSVAQDAFEEVANSYKGFGGEAILNLIIEDAVRSGEDFSGIQNIVDDFMANTNLQDQINRYLDSLSKNSVDSESLLEGVSSQIDQLKEKYPGLTNSLKEFYNAIAKGDNIDDNSQIKVLTEQLQEARREVERIKEEAANSDIDLSQTIFGNIDLNDRKVLQWTDDNLKKYKTALESWYNPDGKKSWDSLAKEMKDSISTVIGSAEEFDGINIAFSPMLQTEDGAVLLTRDTVYKYINKLITEAAKSGNGWTTEDLLKLDTIGLKVDGQLIKGLLADVGDTAIKTSESMHYLGKDGALKQAENNVDKINKKLIEVKNRVKDTAEITISSLSAVGDSLSNLSNATKEVRDDGYVSISTLSKIKEEFADVDGIDNYITKLAKARSNSSDFQETLAELTIGLINSKYSTEELANADESLIANMLRSADVANADAVAHQLVENAKIKQRIATLDLINITYEEANSLISLATQSGATQSNIENLTAALTTLRNTDLNLEDKCNQLLQLAINAQIAMSALGTATSILNGMKKGSVGALKQQEYSGKSVADLQKESIQEILQYFSGVKKDISNVTYKPKESKSSKSGSSKKDNTAKKQRDFNDKIQGYYDDLDEAQKKYDEKLEESYKNEKEKIDDYSQQLTEAQEKFNEDWKEAWDKEHLETLKADLEERMDLIDRYKKAMETVDFGLDLLDENDFTNKSDLLSQKLQDSTNYGAALRAEFERLLTITPQGAEEAQEIADRLSNIGQKMRDNVSTITETQIAIQKLRVEALSSIATTHIDELERELNNIDKRIEILSSDNKNDYKYTSEILNITSVLPLSSDFDKQLREKRRQTRSLVREEQDRQDQINKIITDALALQHKENAEAREKERQDLLADFEKTREDLNKKIAEVKEDAEKERQELYDELEKTKAEIKKKLDSAVLDYQEDTGKIVSSTQSMIDSIQDILNTEIKMPEIDLTDFNNSVDAAVEKAKSAQTTIDNAAKDMAGAGDSGKKSGSSKTTSGSKSSGGSIPAGATVYMYSGNKAGHVGIYDGKGNIISNEGGKITTKSFDKMFASGYYRYRGWGWNGGVALSPSDAAKVVATTSKVKGKGGKCQAWVADVYAKALGNGRVSAATANKAGDQWIIGHATGTPYHPGGLALLGDEGQGKYEAAILPDGSVHIIGRNGAELVDLPMGTSVIPHDETKELLSKTGNIDGKKIPKYAEGTTGVSSVSDAKTAVEISEAYKLLLNKISATEASEAVDRFITQPRFTKLITAIFSKLSNNGVELGYIHPGESLIDTDTLEEYYAIAVKENDVLLKAVLEAGKNAHDYTSALAETDNILMAYSKVGFLNNPDLAETIASKPLGSSGITIADLFKTDEASRAERYAQTLANGGTTDGGNPSTATPDTTDSDSSSKNSLTVEEIEKRFKDIFAPFDKTLKDSSAKESQIWGNSDMSEKDKVYAYFNLAKGNLDALMEPGLEALKQMVAEYTAYMELTAEHPELFNQEIVDAYVSGISELKDRLTSVEDTVANTRKNVINYVTDLNSEIEDYISERNLYNDWKQYGDSLTAAIRRELANLNELYKQGVYSLKEFNKEKAKLEQEYFSYGKQELENAVNREISKIEKKNEKEKELLNFRSSQYEKQKTLLQEHFNITNSIADARHEINKQLNTSKAMYEYLDEDTRKLLFNQKDYNKLSSVLNDMEYEARKLQSKYIKDIQNAEAENIDEITSKYQMQYQVLSKKYEIAKAELEVAKKQQQLNNVLAERNTRMFINGKWQWVANSENVENAMNELEDAKYAQSTANTSLSQTVSLNQLQSAQDGIATQVNLLDKSLNDAREYWEKIQEQIEGESLDLREVLRDIAKSDCPALQNIIDRISDSLVDFYEGMTGKTLTLPENYISTHDYMQEILDSDNSEKVLALNKKRNAKIESEGLEWKPLSDDEILKIWNDRKVYEAAKEEISQFISNLPRNLNGGGEIRLQGDEAFNKLIKDLNTLRAYESAKTDLTTELAKKTWIEIPEGLRGAGNIIFTPDQMTSLQNPMDLAKLDMFKANSVQISVPQSIDSSVDNSITINGLKLSTNEIGQEAFNSLRRYVSTHKR